MRRNRKVMLVSASIIFCALGFCPRLSFATNVSITVSPDKWDVNGLNWVSGTYSGSQTFTVTNNGDVPVNVGYGLSGGAGFSVSSSSLSNIGTTLSGSISIHFDATQTSEGTSGRALILTATDARTLIGGKSVALCTAAGGSVVSVSGGYICKFSSYQCGGSGFTQYGSNGGYCTSYLSGNPCGASDACGRFGDANPTNNGAWGDHGPQQCYKKGTNDKGNAIYVSGICTIWPTDYAVDGHNGYYYFWDTAEATAAISEIGCN